jgi:hypothetical protein
MKTVPIFSEVHPRGPPLNKNKPFFQAFNRDERHHPVTPTSGGAAAKTLEEVAESIDSPVRAFRNVRNSLARNSFERNRIGSGCRTQSSNRRYLFSPCSPCSPCPVAVAVNVHRNWAKPGKGGGDTVAKYSPLPWLSTMDFYSGVDSCAKGRSLPFYRWAAGGGCGPNIPCRMVDAVYINDAKTQIDNSPVKQGFRNKKVEGTGCTTCFQNYGSQPATGR